MRRGLPFVVGVGDAPAGVPLPNDLPSGDEDEEGYNGASAQELEKDRRNDEDEFDEFRGNV